MVMAMMMMIVIPTISPDSAEWYHASFKTHVHTLPSTQGTGVSPKDWVSARICGLVVRLQKTNKRTNEQTNKLGNGN